MNLCNFTFLMLIIICQAHLLADPPTIPLMYNLVLWNIFQKKNCNAFFYTFLAFKPNIVAHNIPYHFFAFYL